MNKLFLLLFFSFAINGSIYALDDEKVKNEIIVQFSKDLKRNQKNKPVMILVGGYPGAGKTTLINALAEKYDIAVISWNAIRQSFLDKHVKFDGEMVKDINRCLFKICLNDRANVIIDSNAHAYNINLFEDLLKEEGCQDAYRVIKICLNPPFEILLKRIRTREQKEGIHQGTETDLINDLNTSFKKINMNDYSLIIRNDDEIPFEKELAIVNSFLQSYFDEQ